MLSTPSISVDDLKGSYSSVSLLHINVNTGHLTVTPRESVANDVLELLKPVVQDQRGYIPGTPGLYVEIFMKLDGERSGKDPAVFLIGDGPFYPGVMPWVIGVACWKQCQSNNGWKTAQILSKNILEPSLGIKNYLPKKPLQAPWLGVMVFPSLAPKYLKYLHLLGDLERCLFWSLADFENGDN